SYSNTNYVLAAMIIHKVTGRSWAREVRDRIIRPLGLRDTSTPRAFPFILGPHAHGYAAFGTSHSAPASVACPAPYCRPPRRGLRVRRPLNLPSR
uniref:serine hydrolase n=1 Tax=Streptomyces sp. NBRC 110028 TaxID=1621260 RepID=UPI000A765CA0